MEQKEVEQYLVVGIMIIVVSYIIIIKTVDYFKARSKYEYGKLSGTKFKARRDIKTGQVEFMNGEGVWKVSKYHQFILND